MVTVIRTAFLLMLPRGNAIRRNGRGRAAEPRSTEDHANPTWSTVHERNMSSSRLRKTSALHSMYDDNCMEYGEQSATDHL